MNSLSGIFYYTKSRLFEGVNEIDQLNVIVYSHFNKVLLIGFLWCVAVPIFWLNWSFIDFFICPFPDEATLNFIHEQLQTKYKNSLPQHNDLYWFPGQICVAQYHADYCWYRAQVIEVCVNFIVISVFYIA